MIYLLLAATVIPTLLTQAFYYFQIKALEKKIDGALDRKVDQVFDVLKREIPMGATFITGTLEEKLKFKASKEVKKLVPDLKSEKTPWKLIFYPILISLVVFLVLSQIV